MPASLPLVLAITGASGAAYAVRLLEVLLEAGREVHLSISPSGQAVIGEELGVRLDLDQFEPEIVLGKASPAVRHLGRLRYFHHKNLIWTDRAIDGALGPEGQVGRDHQLPAIAFMHQR